MDNSLFPCCLDEYACLWNGCEFVSMGSPVELEVHAHFHNYHGKLKFIGSQLLKSRPDLPNCTQGLHSNNLVPEGSDGYVCQWENCDVSKFSRRKNTHEIKLPFFFFGLIQFIFCVSFRTHSTIPSGSIGT